MCPLDGMRRLTNEERQDMQPRLFGLVNVNTIRVLASRPLQTSHTDRPSG